MWGERRSRVRTVTIAVLLLASLIASLIDHPSLRTLSASLSTSTVAVERPVLRLGRWAGLLPRLLRQHPGLPEENRRLRRRVVELEDHLVVVRDQLAQSRRELAAVAELAEHLQTKGTRPLLAEIIGLDAEVAGLGADGWRRTCRVDVGHRAGAGVDNPVVWGRALVGTVRAVAPLGSVVRLTTDPESRVWCYDARSGVEAIARGRGPEELGLEDVRWPADIAEGDVFLTTGKAGRFPRGLVVGVVQGVRRADDGLGAEVQLQPRVSLRDVRSVLVVPWPSAGSPASSTSQ